MVGTCGYCHQPTWLCSCVERDEAHPTTIIHVSPARRFDWRMLLVIVAALLTAEILATRPTPVLRPMNLRLEDAIPAGPCDLSRGDGRPPCLAGPGYRTLEGK